MRPRRSESSGGMYLTSKRRKMVPMGPKNDVVTQILPSGRDGPFWAPGKTTHQVGHLHVHRPVHAIHVGHRHEMDQLYRWGAVRRRKYDAR